MHNEWFKTLSGEIQSNIDEGSDLLKQSIGNTQVPTISNLKILSIRFNSLLNFNLHFKNVSTKNNVMKAIA